MFLWRACRNCLPSHDQLQKRGVSCPMVCTLCAQQVENLWHLFFDCPSSVECWEEQRLWSHIYPRMLQADSFSELCFQVLGSLNAPQRATFVVTLWSIWRQRNEKYWEGTNQLPKQVVGGANAFLTDWTHVKSVSLPPCLPLLSSQSRTGPHHQKGPSNAMLTLDSLSRLASLLLACASEIIRGLSSWLAQWACLTASPPMKVKL